jgi:hypothetical protein
MAAKILNKVYRKATRRRHSNAGVLIYDTKAWQPKATYAEGSLMVLPSIPNP